VVGMLNEVLAILVVSFGIFAIAMFIVLYIHFKKNYNSKHIEEDYKKELDESFIEEDDETEEISIISDVEEDMEFIPKKKN